MQVVLQLYFDHVYMYLHSQTVIENECTEIKIHKFPACMSSI